MTFEEFFKKKKIDLLALQQGEQSLFSEFKTHYEQMGEKSFDHTKKYWFNKLRRRFPASPEIKTEKLRIENQLAEQTITESLIEPVKATPKIGFTPKFKAAGVTAKPAEEKSEIKPEEGTTPSGESTAPKPAFKPRFNPAMVNPKAELDEATPEQKPEIKEEEVVKDTTEAPKPGFKPRFNAAMVKPKPTENTETPAEKAEAKSEETKPATETPKPGFKPRFNAAMMKPKPVENEPPVAKEKPEVKSEAEVVPEIEAPSAKPAYKPRFQAGMVKPKPVEDEVRPEEKPEDMSNVSSPDGPAAKPAYKPRFNMKNIPPKPKEEE
ncbi:hypothetical protein [Mucilaginibacter aquaedulcis]|uniref:hypothetical protein n=1 Tax=Mucilaginibacter aquaedulcis TaxID=1187081 RepID=UPI0025B4A9EB|nr:hypothetical protein [Mucilaginibacter aquaedulcis]MDN3551394.1 hypothetical protein [Mucilaginibacter aquaedulcis]